MTLQFLNARLIDPETLTDAGGTLTVVDGRIDPLGFTTPARAARRAEPDRRPNP